MATANIGLKFGTDGVPELQQIATLLKEINTLSKNPINVNVKSEEVKQITKEEKEQLKIQQEKASTIRRIKDYIAEENELYKQGKKTNTDMMSMYQAQISKLESIGAKRKDILSIETKAMEMERGKLTLLQQQEIAINKSKQSKSSMGNFNSPYSSLMFGGFVAGLFGTGMSEILKLEEAVYNLGVVAEKTNEDINDLYMGFVNLSKEIPLTAVELVKATDEIVRVGFNLSDAMAIAESGARLAVASGDSIQGVTDSLAKVLVSLEMFGKSEDEVTAITNQMQSVILKTPLSTQTLSEGMRHASSAMAVFIQNSTRVGDDLNAYKDRVLQTTLALEGAFARLGRSGSQSGLHIRELYTKIIAMDKSASAMFNKNTLGLYYDEASKAINKTGQGMQITSQYLASLAEKDLPMAVELLSKLYKNGEITTTTLKKMMTERFISIA